MDNTNVEVPNVVGDVNNFKIEIQQAISNVADCLSNAYEWKDEVKRSYEGFAENMKSKISELEGSVSCLEAAFNRITTANETLNKNKSEVADLKRQSESL